MRQTRYPRPSRPCPKRRPTRRAGLAACLMALCPVVAGAQNVYYDDTPDRLRIFIAGGPTYGGDKLASANFADGSTQNLRAGNLAQISGGLQWHVSPRVQAALSIGYQSDSVSTYYGNLRFSRYPLELLAYYQPYRNWRFGGGLRIVLSPDLKGRGDASYLSESFDTAYSPVIEAEYLASPHHGFKLRGVFERYRSTENLPEARANHVGLFFAFYF